MTPLSPHFSLEEMTFSETAVRHNISNNPPPDVLAHLTLTAAGMEKVRALLGQPIQVTSGYRGLAVNAIVGGVPTSAHTLGWACDFKSAFGSPFEVCQAIEGSDLAYDQLIHEYGTWTHVSFDPRMRRQALTIGHNTGGYQQGIRRL